MYKMFGLFGGLFDFNRDGKMDSFEKAAEFATFARMMDSIEAKKGSVEFNLNGNDDELEMMGLNRDELVFMDEEERREALEDAGLDPDDYDF
jgi:hypothetical protein